MLKALGYCSGRCEYVWLYFENPWSRLFSQLSSMHLFYNPVLLTLFSMFPFTLVNAEIVWFLH